MTMTNSAIGSAAGAGFLGSHPLNGKPATTTQPITPSAIVNTWPAQRRLTAGWTIAGSESRRPLLDATSRIYQRCDDKRTTRLGISVCGNALHGFVIRNGKSPTTRRRQGP